VSRAKARPLLDPPLVRRAAIDALRKLDPRRQVRNPVMFVVLVGSVLTTALFCQALLGHGEAAPGFIGWVSAWLWFTVLFANFAEALAEGRGKAQAEALRRARRDIEAHLLEEPIDEVHFEPEAARARSLRELRPAQGPSRARPHGRVHPGDGEIEIGIASVDESAITGESAPVIREAGGEPQRGYRRHARALGLAGRADHRRARRDLPRPDDLAGGGREAPEDAQRDRARHPARGDDDHLSARDRDTAAVLHLQRGEAGTGIPVTVTALVALLVCLIPTTIGGLLSAIGIAGMDRLIQANVIASSGRAVEAAGDVDVLLLDKTGTITLGNRQATEFLPANGVEPKSSPTRRSSRRSPTRRPRAAASSCSRSSGSACASATSIR